jgi:hypothetical protein
MNVAVGQPPQLQSGDNHTRLAKVLVRGSAADDARIRRRSGGTDLPFALAIAVKARVKTPAERESSRPSSLQGLSS